MKKIVSICLTLVGFTSAVGHAQVEITFSSCTSFKGGCSTSLVTAKKGARLVLSASEQQVRTFLPVGPTRITLRDHTSAVLASKAAYQSVSMTYLSLRTAGYRNQATAGGQGPLQAMIRVGY